jgi:LysM repeat protein
MEDTRDKGIDDNTDEFPPFVDSSRPRGPVRSARSGADSGFRARNLVLVVLGVLVVVAVVGIFFVGGDKATSKRLNTINFRIDQWDDRIGRIEGMSQKVSDIEDQIQRLEVSVAKLNRMGTPLREQVEKLNQKMSQLESRLASVQEGAETSPTVAERPVFQSEGRFYEVRRGDTLFRIANNHGLTVNELRSYNELEGSNMIYPGQRLLVVPASQEE